MEQILRWARAQREAYAEVLRQMVECESPSDDAAAVDHMVDLLSDLFAPLGKIYTVKARGHGRHLMVEFAGGRHGAGQVLILGHSDTVWPLGTLKRMPFRKAEGRLFGPGTLDMKGGLAMVLFAMRALKETSASLPHKVLLQVNSDEEVGSPTSRPLTEANAKQSQAVLVMEPGVGLEGKLKTSRKGVGGYRVRVQGRSAHAGVDFQDGASAVVELARQVEKIAGFTDLPKGITVNPGVIAGGTKSNVVAEQAHCEVDFRVTKATQAKSLERKFRGLRPFDRRCQVSVEGGLNRPPMERSAGVIALYRRAQKVAKSMGIEIDEASTGGGSDGNFTAGLGIPTLDGLGTVGEGAHAVNESILIDPIPERIALLAGLLLD